MTPNLVDALAVASELPELSAPGVVLLDIAGAAVAPLLDSAQAVVADAVADAVAEAIGNAVAVVPVIGAFVNLLVEVLKLPGALAEARRQELAAECQREFQRRKVVPSGSKLGGCETCPTDFFRLVGKARERSLVGAALIAITEGYSLDGVPEETLSVPLPGERPGASPETRLANRRAYQRERYALIRARSKAGLDEERRRKYATLRLAIQDSFAEPGQRGSDGGVALWPAYLDMLLSDVDAGRLSKEYIDLCLSVAYVPKGATKAPVHGLQETLQASCYVPALRDAVIQLVNGWRNTVRPRYEEGQKELADMEALADRKRLAKYAARLRLKVAPAAQPPTRPLLVAASALAAATASAAGLSYLRKRRARR